MKFDLKKIEETFGQRKPKLMGHYSYYAVLLPLVIQSGKLQVLFEVRSDNLKRQPGEVCFPGGRIEQHETREECAIRETMEELNLRQEDITIINALDFINTYSDFTLYPFLGILRPEAVKDLSVNQEEVKETFLVPLQYFLETDPYVYHFDVIPDVKDDFPYEMINSQRGYNWRKGCSEVPIYHYEGRVIWGLTARIVQHFALILKGERA